MVGGTVVSAVEVCSVVVVVVSGVARVAAAVIWDFVVVSTVVVTGADVAGIFGIAVAVLSTGCVVAVVVAVVTITRCAVLSSFAAPLQAPAAHSTAMQTAAALIARPVFLFFVIINPSIPVLGWFLVPTTIPRSGGIYLCATVHF